MRVFWNPQDPRQLCKPVLDRQVILDIRKVTSGAVSTDVADLEAAPEVDKTKSVYYEIEPTNLQYVSLMYLIHVLAFQIAIVMVYGDIASHFR